MTSEPAPPSELKAVPVRHPGRWVTTAVLGVLVAMLVHSMVANPRWGWHYTKQYAFTSPVLHGVLVTLELTAAAMAIGILGGILLAVMRLSPNPVVSTVSWFYIWIFRGTPVLVQILIWFGISYLFPRVSLGVPFGPTFVSVSTNTVVTPLVAGILGLGLNEAAYMAEIVRAGILSVDEGQAEAASALGMTRGLVMRRVVLPQAMRVIVPPTGNETISMLKTSSLVSAIGAVPDLLQQTQSIINVTYATIPLFIMASLWYLFLTSILTVGQFYVERYYGRGTRHAAAVQPLLLTRIGRAIVSIRPQQ